MSEVDETYSRGEGFPDKAEFERIRERGRDRLLQLSKPKEPKVEWWTSVGPNVKWGTQDMLWPIPKSAMTTLASNRVSELATPKRNFQKETNIDNHPLFYYSCGRSSVLWNVSPKAMASAASQRVMELAKPKRSHQEYMEHRPQFFYSCGRSSPIWDVDEGAAGCGDRARTVQLAQHKPYHKDFQSSRQVQTVIPSPALKARTSERIESLATPKDRNPGPFREPQWTVSAAAKNSSASTRSMELARAKGTTEGFQPAKEVEWPVTRAAKRAVASSRLDELSQPIVRASMDHVQFNPDAFVVRESALKGVVPRRIEDLAQPIQRG
ncbi:testicular haploid expressed gene protein-like isoform X1 [Haliotis rufescens]|uniref:testicular haploid expressed gene protein-like isoform X1 n=1 Tax=Haliotis rufescens TaxID=6454 RepID=UPI001EB07BE7|nr:testicular haploid expressed gene protein-like isoform X1 [Haliotis rufescens]